MRVMVTINGKVSVHEILEFEPQEDGSVLLTTPEGCVDLLVTSMNEARMEAVCRELLKLGYTDITEYETIYDYVFEDDCEDDEDEEMFRVICACCGQSFVFQMTPDIAATGCIRCPHCGEDLEWNPADVETEDAEEDDEDALAYECVCPQCKMTIEVSQGDVDAGRMTCPICKTNLEFDAIDAENFSVGDCEENDEE